MGKAKILIALIMASLVLFTFANVNAQSGNNKTITFLRDYLGVDAAFGRSDTAYLEFQSNINDTIILDSIYAKHKTLNISIGKDSILKPFIIKPFAKNKLRLIYIPKNRNSKFTSYDTIMFFSNKNQLVYEFEVWEGCYHLSYENRNVKQIKIKRTQDVDYLDICTCSYSKVAERGEFLNAGGVVLKKFLIYFDPPCDVKINIEYYKHSIYRVKFYDFENKPIIEQEILIE